jgi:hypothetical protein
MFDSTQSGFTPASATATGKRPARRKWALLIVVLTLLIFGVVAFLIFGLPNNPADAGPLDGNLVVIVRPPERAVEPLAVEEPGAVPVRSGGIMSLQAQLNQPAYAFLVWLDSEGQVVPLYPWNHDSLDVRDINQAPPNRKATNVIYNPPIGGGWKFGKTSGLETVLLLARRTHLPTGTQLGPLFAGIAPPSLRNRNEVAVLSLANGADSVSTQLALNRGNEADAQTVDEPLRAAMLKLRDHFELIVAVRFAHEEK